MFYFDPYKITDSAKDADIVFITHSHYDHLSIDDIVKVMNDRTHFIMPRDCFAKFDEAGIDLNGRFTTFTEESFGGLWFCFDRFGMKFQIFRSYNSDKKFHPKDNDWVGYIVEIDGVTYAVCGDTDATEELRQIKCDVLFIPIGGTYTMTAQEAAAAANIIRPKIAVPIHYNSIVGSKADEKIFTGSLARGIKCRIFF